MLALEAVGVAIAACDFLEKRLRGEIDRYKKFSKNPALVDALVETVAKLKHQLYLLEGKCKQLGSKLSSEWDKGILSSRSATVSDNLKSIEDRLKEESEQSKRHGKRRHIPRRYSRAKSTCEMLTECEADARAVERDVVEIYNLAVQAEQATLAQRGNSVQEEILNRMPPAAEQDVFRASFDVEENPDHVVLQYGFVPRVGEEDDGATASPEAQLKRAVLGAPEADNITAAVGSLGMGGVGKSCALRGLAGDQDVRRRFPDGVYMVVFGEKASKVDVVKGMSNMVKRSGGKNLAHDMRKEEGDVREALSQAGIWFQSKRILLLVDDVWGNSEVKSSIIGQLRRSVVSGESRLAFTTRDARIASEHETIKFGERDEVASREILLKAAGARAGGTRSFEDVVKGVVELCAGLPLALAIAGKNIAVQFQNSNKERWREAWAETLTAIRRHRNLLVVDSDYDYDKHNLEAVCESSLETLEGGRRGRLGFEPEMSVHEMYRCLVIQKKQAAVPVGVLRRLWGMDEDCDALRALDMFVEVSMAERRSVTVNGEVTACLSLHDLQLDFVQAKCKEQGGEEQHHRKLLNGWWDGAGPSREVGGQGKRDWSRSEAFDDEYMRNNLSRHLVGAGLGSELRGLLRNPEWTAERLRKRELLGLEEDFGLAMGSVECEGGVEEGRGSGERERWGLEMICGAARLSSSFVVRSPREVWFQLRGRLVGLAEKSGVIREFVDKIDGYAERPWARPTWACLSEPGGRVLSIAKCAGRVEDMRRGEREGEMRVCGVVEGMGFICSVVNGEMEGEEVYVNKRAEGGCECAGAGEDEGVMSSGDEGSVCDGCSENCVDWSMGVEWSAVRSVRYIGDEGRVVTRHENGTTRMWDGACGEVMGGPFGGYGKRCEWSADGGRVVCGGRDGSVRIWDGVSGGAAGGDEHAHSDCVSCVKWSVDGSRVVSGGEDGSVRTWDGVSGETVGGDEHAHDDEVSCIEWSADGSRIVSGATDGSVRIWDGASGETVGGDEHAHGEEVSCIEWSADGSRVVSGAEDGSVRIWEGAGGEVIGRGNVASGESLNCIEWLADGSRFVSGGMDGSVRTWDGVSGGAVGRDDCGHGGEANRVEWSPDGSRVVSCGLGGSVKIWDGASGEVVGGDVRAHGGEVNRVVWAPNRGRVLSGATDGSVRIWDGVSGELVGGDERAHGGTVWCVDWSADGSRIVSGGVDGSVRIWDGASGEAVGGDNRAHGGEVIRVTWAPDGSRVLSGATDGSVRIWDGASGEAVGGDELAHGGGVTCVEWSADGSRFVSSGRVGSVRIWDGASGGAVGGDEHAHVEGVCCVEWSADGSRFVSGGGDGSVRMWDSASGETVGGDEHAHSHWVSCFRWSADGRWVLSGGSDGSVKIWDGANGEAVGGEERAHGFGVNCVEWSADGSRVLSGGSDGSVKIWDSASGEAVGGDEHAHGGEVSCVGWSADGSMVLSGGKNGSVRVWDGASGAVVGGDEHAHGGEVRRVEWLRDGRRVVSSGFDASVRMWDGVSGEAIDTEAEACETRPVKRSHSYTDVGPVDAAGLPSARDYGGEHATQLCGEEYKARRWAAVGRSLELWCGGRKVLLATFEVDHRRMHGAEVRNMKGAVVLGFLKDRSMYRLDIVK